jgi:hypothetical protein
MDTVDIRDVINAHEMPAINGVGGVEWWISNEGNPRVTLICEGETVETVGASAIAEITPDQAVKLGESLYIAARASLAVAELREAVMSDQMLTEHLRQALHEAKPEAA